MSSSAVMDHITQMQQEMGGVMDASLDMETAMVTGSEICTSQPTLPAICYLVSADIYWSEHLYLSCYGDGISHGHGEGSGCGNGYLNGHEAYGIPHGNGWGKGWDLQSAADWR